MRGAAPRIDQRTEEDIVNQVQGLLQVYVPEGGVLDRDSGQARGVARALIGVFARYCEIIIHRLNRVPEKNFLAYLDLLGASPVPPQAARAPIAFGLVPGAGAEVRIPAGTQVAGIPARNDGQPVIFETERDFVAVPAQLDAIFARDPGNDRYSDLSAVLQESTQAAGPPFRGVRPIEHAFFVGNDQFFGLADIAKVSLIFQLKARLPPEWDARSLQWELWNGVEGIAIHPVADSTEGLTRSGEVVFADLPSVSQQVLQGFSSRWLRCRLITPVNPSARRRKGMVRAGQLPTIEDLKLRLEADCRDLPLEKAFANLSPVDLSREFLPFGEKPKFGDVLYLAHANAFAVSGARVSLHVDLTNPAFGSPEPPVARTNIAGHPKVRWETWNGEGWVGLGTGEAETDVEDEATSFIDTTRAFTTSGYVGFVLPKTPATTPINGVEGYWVRVRIVSGDYGKEALYIPRDPHAEKLEYVLVPATFAPPSIRSVRVDYGFELGPAPPERILLRNDFAFEDVSQETADDTRTFLLFRSSSDPSPSLYLGFELPPGRTNFRGMPISIFFRVEPQSFKQVVATAPDDRSEAIVWEYWNGQQWARLSARDHTKGLKHTGMVEFLAPADLCRREEFGRLRYWIRSRLQEGKDHSAVVLQRIALNATMASQAVTIRNEVLGVGNGTDKLRLRIGRTPILMDQELEVFENGAWAVWNEVPDFYGSGPGDPHYVLDRLTGEIRFGNGKNGRFPPAGAQVRMAAYKTGGGIWGNMATGTICQLKSTIPYVERVTSPGESSGGANAESVDSMRNRAPRSIRHRGRAVTIEDYEDLAALTSPEVARAKCVPLYDLRTDPQRSSRRPGVVSLVVVPRVGVPKPRPSLELMERVERYLKDRVAPHVSLVVVGPAYVRVDVDVEIALTALETSSVVEANVLESVAGFLHPLTGGRDGTGWDFGRKPHDSDLYPVIGSVPGVEHVRTLAMTLIEDRPGLGRTSHFLVYSGIHTVRMVVV